MQCRHRRGHHGQEAIVPETSSTSEKRATVTIHVNERPVRLEKHRESGLEIKAAAIAQGVEIKPDFILVEEAHGGHEARVVGDDDVVKVTTHSKFTANDGDDNS
jgi:hypothetical protein